MNPVSLAVSIGIVAGFVFLIALGLSVGVVDRDMLPIGVAILVALLSGVLAMGARTGRCASSRRRS